MVYNRTVGSNTIRAYGEILSFFGRVAYEFGQKFVNIPDYTENPVGCRNFWRLYKKQAKNQDALNEWNRMFATGKPWKNPRDGSWRFYFNLTDDNKQAEKQYQTNLMAEIREIAEKEAKELFDNNDEMKLITNELTFYEEPEVEIIEKVEKSEKAIKKVSPGFNFSADQLKTIKNLK